MKTLRATLAAFLLVASGASAGEEPKKGDDPLAALEKRMAELLNRDRAKEKLPPLTYDPKLAAVARAHSQDMKDNHFSGHESKRTGKVQNRLAKAHIPFRGAGENIACCANVEIAQAALMRSPKHRDNILCKEFTRFGVGIVLSDEGWTICTQVFTCAPPVYDVAAVQAQVLEGINRERLAQGLRRLILDDNLTQQALSHSERAARLGRPDPLWLEDRLATDDAQRWRIREALYRLTDKPGDVATCELALEPRYDHYGLGIVQAPLDSKASGALWITLICAQRK